MRQTSPGRLGREGTLTTLRPTASLWRRTRATLLAGSIALGTLLAPGAALADTSGAAGANTDSTTAGYQWDGGSLTDATAYVISRGGLDLRDEPSRDADVLTTIPDGSLVDLRIDETDTVVDGDGVTRWWPVAYGGQSGWVPGQFLTDAAPESAGLTSKDSGAPTTTSSTSGTTTTSTNAPFEWNGTVLESATATVSSDGERVNVRAEPSADSAIVTKVDDGALVNLRIAEVDTVTAGGTRWWPVVVDGQPGWISGDLLTNSNAAVFPAGATAQVQTRDGAGAKLRAAAGFDADQIGSVPEGATVTIVSGPASHNNSANGWFEVEYNGTRGYVDGDLLVLLTAPAASASASTASTSARSGAAPAASASTSASSTTAGTQPSDTDNQIPTTQPTQAAGLAPAGQQPTQAAAGEQPATTPGQQPTQAPSTNATEPAQQEQGEQPDTDATRPWDSTTPTATTTPTRATTPTPTPTQAASGEVSSAGFIRPVNGATLTQSFGCSSLGFYPYNPDWGCGVHDGVDYAAPAYTPIYAVADGKVVTAGWCDCGLGYYVEIDHGNGVHTLYGHMATQPTVRTGQTVKQGQQIGPMGSTGLSTGPHVHFMVQVNGVSQDPARYLP